MKLTHVSLSALLLAITSVAAVSPPKAYADGTVGFEASWCELVEVIGVPQSELQAVENGFYASYDEAAAVRKLQVRSSLYIAGRFVVDVQITWDSATHPKPSDLPPETCLTRSYHYAPN